ncbi:hypothetical protein WDL1P1_00348 (plasmid) [Variovorax sp. WDL1]|uniref:hypothetical protein n=2 Tax=Variovorax TaxID=34072 RepID=UPI00076D525F|nr:hypothetical protein [Variovorax sp. WDL1]KWT98207.1 hypothetical protein APY03_0878 [Variovorax sp. WDL1]PNG50299.1 hypothetical protein CHC06_05922 [Variovorax sp. B2]PNG51172.1 hypothetical protein CHC07_05828 [Variovorax sp. B4]VTV17385.1 hypothetical protein WDL1P1_00348 [Variovorax sp. WDL1]
MENMFFQRLRRLSVALLAAVSFASAAQQPTPARLQAEISRWMQRYVSDETLLEKTVSNSYGPNLAPPKREAVKAMLRTVMVHERMAPYLTKVVLPFYGKQLGTDESKNYVLEAVVELQVKGLRRLPTEVHAQFLRYILDMAAATQPTVCKALFLGKMGTQQSAVYERRYMASLPTEKFEAVLGMYQAAALAELDGYPDVKPLNPTQAKAAESAYAVAVKSRIARMPLGLHARVSADIEGGEPTEVCAWFRDTVGAALDLHEPYLGWYLTRFIQAM